MNSSKISYNNEEWKYIKIPFVLITLLSLAMVLFSQRIVQYPLGICNFFDCSIVLTNYGSFVLFSLSIIASVFYVFEKKMLLALTTLSAISVITFTSSDSTGIFNRYDILSMILIAQLMAYIFSYFSVSGKAFLSKNRVQFPVQMIAAAYTLAGLSKLYTTGISWGFSYDGLAIQVKKAIAANYLVSGEAHLITKMDFLVNFVLSNPTIISFFLLLTLFIESFSFLAAFSKKYAFYWGILLSAMHLGIFIFMNILIMPIFMGMLLFFVNPFYLASNLFKKNE